MSKTVKELADEIGVSKTAIRNKMTDEFRSKWVRTIPVNGVQTLVITGEGINIIKSRFRGDNQTENKSQTKVSDQSSVIQVEFDFLQQQLREKDIQIENLQKLLDQSQQLMLSDKKQSQLLLEERKGESTPSNWEQEKRLLEERIERFKNICHELTGQEKENQVLLTKARRNFWFAVMATVVLFTVLVIKFFMK